MIFAQALEETMKGQKVRTENGALGFKTSKSCLVDFNFKASSFRNESESEIEDAFADAYNENPLLAIKLLFMTGDIRQGMGERRTFRVCLKWLAKWHKEEAEKVIALIPEYSRWDVLVDMLGTNVDAKAFEIIKKQLQDDINNCLTRKPISLLAKWLPSINTSNKNVVLKGRSICARLHISERQYRKKLAMLRAYSNVVEVKMSANNWGEINYESVPSKANLIYKEAFMKHDEERRTDYIASLKNGSAKINASASFPYEIVAKYDYRSNVDDVLEQMWKALPDYANGKGENVICVVDGSGSMTSTIAGTNVSCEDVAQSLGIYFAEKLPGQFHNKYITFSQNPKFVNFEKCKTLREKLYEADRHTECENTNIYKVFELILRTATKHKLSQEDMPNSILIISDVEFDSAVSFCDTDYYWAMRNNGRNVFDSKCKALFETIANEYKDAGYELPKLVFWNVCSRTGAIPLQENKNGVVLVSGFSPTIASMVFSQKNNPYDVLVEKLNSKRYKPIEKALA